MNPIGYGFPSQCDVGCDVPLFSITRDVPFVSTAEVKWDADNRGEYEKNQDTQSLISRQRSGNNSHDRPNQRRN